MAAIAIQNVSKQFATQCVLDAASLELRTGETVGIVGANGSGKTTLFRLIAGELTPDKGTITCARGVRVGLLRQEPDFGEDRTLHDEVGSVFADLLALEAELQAASERMATCLDAGALPELMDAYERVNVRFMAAGGHGFETRLNEILGGLGFQPSDYSRRVSELSGGQKCRVALAKLLLSDGSFLLLDEPTNHLDIDAVRWLEKFLAGHHGGAAIISHDRYLLDRLCDRVIEVERAKVSSFPGNYSNYALTKQTRALARERQHDKDAAFIKKEREFITKHIAGQRTKEAQGRRTRLERRLKAGEFVTDASKRSRSLAMDFDRADASSGIILRVEKLSMAFDRDPLFSDLSFQIHPGERFGITGPNGTGKTTLLKILVGELAATAGQTTFDPALAVSYYAQEHGTFPPERTVVEQVKTELPDYSEHELRSLLARYLFTGDDVFKTLGSLSGGEQSRLRLAALISQSPDILILDEPTNHLDIASREVLEQALLAFAGVVIVVSHDRYFLDQIVGRLLVLRPEGHSLHDGNYSAYVAQLEQAPSRKQSPARNDKKRARSERKPPKSAPSPFDSLSTERLETMIMEQEEALAALQERFGDPAVYQNPETLAKLRSDADATATELAQVEAAWHERVDAQ